MRPAGAGRAGAADPLAAAWAAAALETFAPAADTAGVGFGGSARAADDDCRPRSLDGVAKASLVIDRNVNLGQQSAICHPGENLLGDFGKEGSSHDVVHIASATLDLATTAGNAIDEFIAVAKGRVVVLAHSAADTAKLEFDDSPHHRVGDRVERHHDQATQEGLLEDLQTAF